MDQDEGKEHLPTNPESGAGSSSSSSAGSFSPRPGTIRGGVSLPSEDLGPGSFALPGDGNRYVMAGIARGSNKELNEAIERVKAKMEKK